MNILVCGSFSFSLPPRARKHRQVDYRDSDMRDVCSESAEIRTLPPRAGKHRQDSRCLQRMLPEGRATGKWRVQGAEGGRGQVLVLERNDLDSATP